MVSFTVSIRRPRQTQEVLGGGGGGGGAILTD